MRITKAKTSLEIASDWFESLSEPDKKQYIKDHPNSKFGNSSKSMHDGLHDKAAKKASKAQDGTLNYKDETYTFKFNPREWNYDVYDKDNDRVITLKSKSLSDVKKEFKKWMES